MDKSIAVFIDADNVNAKDGPYIVKEIQNKGRIVLSKVYGDWSQNDIKNWRTIAQTNGIEPVQCDRISGKNSTDIKIGVDIMKTLYTIKHIDIFYIVSSDCDYRHVMSEIKLLNKKVYCIGSKKSNKSLQSSCDIFTKIEVLRHKHCEFSQELRETFFQDIVAILSERSSVNMSLINDVLIRKYQFDFREYNCDSFKKFLKKYYKELDLTDCSNISFFE